MMTQYIFATESYPFTADLASLLPLPPDEAILLTKDVHRTLSEADRARFSRIVEVDGFDLDSLNAALTRIAPQRGARLVSHDDFFYEQFAQVGPSHGVSVYTLESILPFVNKHVMKQRLKGSSVRLPRYRLFNAKAFASQGVGWLRQLAEELFSQALVSLKPCSLPQALASSNTARSATKKEHQKYHE